MIVAHLHSLFALPTRDATTYLLPLLPRVGGRRLSLLWLGMRARVLLSSIPSLKPKVEVAFLDGG